MFSRLNDVERKLKSLQDRLADPLLPQNPKEFQAVAKEQAALQPLIETYDRYRSIKKQIEENKTLLAEESDASIREMAKEELPALEAKLEALAQELKVALLPKDPNDEKNIFLEIRAGTGGDEASLFAADLFRMYSRYAETMGWKVDLTSSNETGMGGFKEIICQISGEKVYSKLKYESGVHRVQRVPKTEANGRVHTSAVTVAVMPEVEDIEIDIQDKDLRIDVFRSGGHGGQSVNTTDSAVRVTYLPLNMVVICQDGKSQHKNKAQALKVLKARLYDKKMTEQNDSIAKERKEQVGSGDRSEKIRTYNFPQNRVTDHRIGLTLYQLDEAMNGKLDSLISPLQAHFQAEALKSA